VPIEGGAGIKIKEMLFCLNVFEGLKLQKLHRTYRKYPLFAPVFSKNIFIFLRRCCRTANKSRPEGSIFKNMITFKEHSEGKNNSAYIFFFCSAA
jgi:hypothetical protein